MKYKIVERGADPEEPVKVRLEPMTTGGAVVTMAHRGLEQSVLSFNNDGVTTVYQVDPDWAKKAGIKLTEDNYILILGANDKRVKGGK